MFPIYEGSIKNRKLVVPHQEAKLELILGAVNNPVVTFWTFGDIPRLAIHPDKIFQEQFGYLNCYEHRNLWRCLLSESSLYTNNGLEPVLLRKFVGEDKVPKSIEVYVEELPNGLLVFEKKYRQAHDVWRSEEAQSTVNSSESCPTSNSPILAPASSQP